MPPCRHVKKGGLCGFSAGFEGHPCPGLDCIYRDELPGLADLKAILVYLLEI